MSFLGQNDWIAYQLLLELSRGISFYRSFLYDVREKER